jgi:hypothetical protein
MNLENIVRYLFDQGFNFDVKFEIEVSDKIYVKYEDKVYTEPLFQSEDIGYIPSFFRELQQILSNDPLETDVNPAFSDSGIPLLNVSYWFLTETYLEKGHYDTHNRQVYPEGNNKNLDYILSFPIVDIIACYFGKYFNIKRKQSKIYLTCDYDILNIWYSLGFFNSIKYITGFLIQKDYSGFFATGIDFFLYFLRIKRKSPYLNDDMFSYDNNNIENIAFWLIDYRNKQYDIQNFFTDKHSKIFIKHLKNKGVTFGLHPSYNTLLNPEILEEQLINYKTLFDNAPKNVRFHYLRANYPETLNVLLANNITDDFSFYFTESILFRGGKSSPFKAWDEKRSAVIDVIIHPITLMEGTLSDYLKLDYENAEKLSIKKLKLALKYGTEINLLWHNRSMYKYGIPNNYSHKVFDTLLKEIKQHLNKQLKQGLNASQ